MVTQPGAPTWTLGPTLELLFQRAQTATRQGVPLSTRRSCLSRQKCTHRKLIVQEVDGTSHLPQITKTGQITLITASPPLQYRELKLDKLRKLWPNCQSHVFNTCSMDFAKSWFLHLRIYSFTKNEFLWVGRLRIPLFLLISQCLLTKSSCNMRILTKNFTW